MKSRPGWKTTKVTNIQWSDKLLNKIKIQDQYHINNIDYSRIQLISFTKLKWWTHYYTSYEFFLYITKKIYK